MGTCEKDYHKYQCVMNDLDCDAIKSWIRVRKKKTSTNYFRMGKISQENLGKYNTSFIRTVYILDNNGS